jgi:hypothetical protein
VSKYEKYTVKPKKERRWRIHPIWRGIGCIMAILIPLISYTAAYILARANYENGWVSIPAELTGWVNLAPVLRLAPWIGQLISASTRIYKLDLALTVVLTIIFFGLLTLLYSILYTSTGVTKTDPYYVPPVRKSPKKSSYK